MQIIYEPHPVSPERKAELRAAGFKIIDARFAPADAIAPADGAQDDRPKRARRAKVPQ